MPLGIDGIIPLRQVRTLLAGRSRVRNYRRVTVRRVEARPLGMNARDWRLVLGLRCQVFQESKA